MVMLVGNKNDLSEEEREITATEALEIAELHGISKKEFYMLKQVQKLEMELNLPFTLSLCK